MSVLEQVDYDDPVVVTLLRQVQETYVGLYGGGDETVLHASEFRPPHGVFLLLRVDGEPVAMGGWRSRDREGEHLRDGDAEIKRMYVVSGARRRGYARTVLAGLECTAAEAGRCRMVLETGLRQPEAIALYTGCGYVPMGRFGRYANEPGSRYYAKRLGH